MIRHKIPGSNQKCFTQHVTAEITIITHPLLIEIILTILFEWFVLRNPYINENEDSIVKTVQQRAIVSRMTPQVPQCTQQELS